MSYKNLVQLVFAIIIAVVTASFWSTLPASAEENKPEIIVNGTVIAGYTTTITVRTNYPYWDLYFTTNHGVKEYPAICSKNAVGGITCPMGGEYTFTVEVFPADELWIFARTTFGSTILQTEVIEEVSTNDFYQVRPGEKSEWLYYLGNDNLGPWHSTGVLAVTSEVSYTLPSPGVIQFNYPVTGTYVLTYFADNDEGRHISQIYLEVTPDAPASEYPELGNDYFEMIEGETQNFNLFANDQFNSAKLLSYGIVSVEGDVNYASWPFGRLEVISPTVGVYTFTYQIQVVGIWQESAQAIVHVIPVEKPVTPSQPEQPVEEPVEQEPTPIEEPETPEQPEEPSIPETPGDSEDQEPVIDESPTEVIPPTDLERDEQPQEFLLFMAHLEKSYEDQENMPELLPDS